MCNHYNEWCLIRNMSCILKGVAWLARPCKASIQTWSETSQPAMLHAGKQPLAAGRWGRTAELLRKITYCCAPSIRIGCIRVATVVSLKNPGMFCYLSVWAASCSQEWAAKKKVKVEAASKQIYVQHEDSQQRGLDEKCIPNLTQQCLRSEVGYRNSTTLKNGTTKEDSRSCP